MAAEFTTLDALQALHRDLSALREGRAEQAAALGSNELIDVFQRELGKIWNRPEKSATERQTVTSGKVTLDDEEFDLNQEFRDVVLMLSDETESSELGAARVLLESQDDVQAMGRPLLQCGLLRFHQQRRYALDSLRLLLELDRISEEETSEALDRIKQFVDTTVFAAPPGSTQRPAERCLAAMAHVRALLKKVADKITAASFLDRNQLGELSGDMQTIEFSRVSLYQQHELLGVVLSRIIEKNLGKQQDFTLLLDYFKKADRYDAFLVHMIPGYAAFVDRHAFEGDWAKMKPAMAINAQLTPKGSTSAWPLQYMQAGLRALWLVEYSGFFVEEPPEGTLDRSTNIDQEDKQKTKDFTDALKDGGFDFLLALVADVKTQEWQDPARVGMRQWLQRKTPALVTDWTQFSHFFQTCLVQHLEVFVDAFITNLPDVLRRLRVEEDEQRQLSQTHEHDLDLERFLIIIAYTYEGRPDAAGAFWNDPDSNLAGFMHWASRRASTPLVTAFCEMLQAISENMACANSAHEFLLDEGHHASGKMRRSQSLTWQQIFKELVFFSNKIREKAAPAQTMQRHGKPSSEQAEAEPESAMMLECYLRLMTKLATASEHARQFLLRDASPSVIDLLFQLASSQIPSRLRACAFSAVRALLSRKSLEEGHTIWHCVDTWATGGYSSPPATHVHHRLAQPPNSMDRVFEELGSSFEESLAFIQLLATLILPSEDNSPLSDGLPFPENLGATSRLAGIEPYVDFVVGNVFSAKSNDVSDPVHQRMLRLACLDFALTCLNTFNEDLIVLANTTTMMVDKAIATTDLATYVRLHPSSRVMEWMFNDKVMNSLFNTVHQEPADVSHCAPDSPLLQGILRGVQVIQKVLELQATYVDLVRPVLKQHASQRRTLVVNPAYSSLEDGLLTRLKLVVDLGIYCGLGHADLTLACLKLLEKMSASPRISSIWSSSHSRYSGRNKAIVALETDGEHEPIARSLISDLRAPLQPGEESDSPSYLIKLYILEFLYTCLKQNPRRPTIAHLLLGFKCSADTLSIEPQGAFDTQTSLFHALFRLLVETPSSDESGVRLWMVTIRAKAISILQILWSSPLSASLVLEELRLNEFLFHLLLGEVVIQPHLLWEGESVAERHFCVTDGASTLVNFVTLRAWALDYMAMELCSIAQARQPALKRRILEALNGSVSAEDGERIDVPTIFDLYDFQLPAQAWTMPPPALTFYENIELDACLETDRQGRRVYNIDRVKEVLLLKDAENKVTGEHTVATGQDLAAVDREEILIIEWLTTMNNQSMIMDETLKVLQSWTRLLLVMIESNDFKGTARTSFFLQGLQAILPSLEAYATDLPVEALELAKLARILVSKLDFSGSDPLDGDTHSVGNLISERLFQLFQICLAAIGRYSGDSVLRTVYYSICFRYISGMADPTGPLAASRHKASNAVHIYGERLLNVVCDDATGGDVACQTAALILLNGLVAMGIQEGDGHVIDAMNRLNFVGILVDSLKHVLADWMAVIDSGNVEQQHFHETKLALLLQLAQTREGAKHIVNANLFRSLQLSSLFAADPELQANPAKPKALELLYTLLVTVARIVSAAILSRGAHNTLQGLRFLRDYRTLVSHTLKRSAGIGPVGAPGQGPLDDKIADLADAFMILIVATGFLESEENEIVELQQKSTVFFH